MGPGAIKQSGVGQDHRQVTGSARGLLSVRVGAYEHTLAAKEVRNFLH
jgi:hypothetical protein